LIEDGFGKKAAGGTLINDPQMAQRGKSFGRIIDSRMILKTVDSIFQSLWSKAQSLSFFWPGVLPQNKMTP
jgi:hypothetical protein